jgi:hypothetical protein
MSDFFFFGDMGDSSEYEFPEKEACDAWSHAWSAVRGGSSKFFDFVALPPILGCMELSMLCMLVH